MHEQPLDVRAGAEMIRRRRGLVIGLGVVGLIAGVAYARMSPAMPSATALVVLPPSATSRSGGKLPIVGRSEQDSGDLRHELVGAEPGGPIRHSSSRSGDHVQAGEGVVGLH